MSLPAATWAIFGNREIKMVKFDFCFPRHKSIVIRGGGKRRDDSGYDVTADGGQSELPFFHPVPLE